MISLKTRSAVRNVIFEDIRGSSESSDAYLEVDGTFLGGVFYMRKVPHMPERKDKRMIIGKK